MTCYIAAPFKRKEEAREARLWLDSIGIGCTSRWIDTHFGTDVQDPGVMAEEASADIEDILNADFFVGLNYEEFKLEGAGRHFEQGFAMGMLMPTFIVGPASNVFHYLQQVKRVPDLAALLEELKHETIPQRSH